MQSTRALQHLAARTASVSDCVPQPRHFVWLVQTRQVTATWNFACASSHLTICMATSMPALHDAPTGNLPAGTQLSQYFYAYCCRKAPLTLKDDKQPGSIPAGWCTSTRQALEKLAGDMGVSVDLLKRGRRTRRIPMSEFLAQSAENGGPVMANTQAGRLVRNGSRNGSGGLGAALHAASRSAAQVGDVLTAAGSARVCEPHSSDAGVSQRVDGDQAEQGLVQVQGQHVSPVGPRSALPHSRSCLSVSALSTPTSRSCPHATVDASAPGTSTQPPTAAPGSELPLPRAGQNVASSSNGNASPQSHQSLTQESEGVGTAACDCGGSGSDRPAALPPDQCFDSQLMVQSSQSRPQLGYPVLCSPQPTHGPLESVALQSLVQMCPGSPAPSIASGLLDSMMTMTSFYASPDATLIAAPLPHEHACLAADAVAAMTLSEGDENPGGAPC